MSPDAHESPPLRRPSLFRQLFKIAMIGLGVLVVLAILAVVFENWRGQQGWRKFRAEWEARGERFDLVDFVPKPVPDEQNFAATPFLAPLFNYNGRPRQWKDRQGYERAKAFGEVFKSVSAQGDAKRTSVPMSGQWQTATFIDLVQWQEYFQANTAFAAADPPQDPARDVLAALKQFDPVLDELRAASARPSCVFPIHYDENFDALLPHLAAIKGVAQIVRLRALALLAAGQSAPALLDVKFNLRLAEALKNEPLLISQLVRISILQMAMQPVWEGLARHEWTDEQLADLQKTLAAIHVLEDYGRTIRGERAFSNDLCDKLRTGELRRRPAGQEQSELPYANSWFLPGGWYYQNQISLNRLYQERAIPLVDAAQHRLFPDRVRAAEDPPERWKRNPYTILSKLLYPALTKAAVRFARTETALDQAVVACALERYRLAGNQYPNGLDALVPRYLARIPTDVITGEPLKYERTADGLFVLYSVGWNQTDDGGEASVRKRGAAANDSEGDWVWRYR